MVIFLTVSQVSVQPVGTTGPEHSKPLEKADGLFAQERDPRFSEIYSNINAGVFLPRSPLDFFFSSGTDWPAATTQSIVSQHMPPNPSNF